MITLDDFPESPAIDFVREFVRSWQTDNPIRAILLYGPPGVGKTTAARAAAALAGWSLIDTNASETMNKERIAEIAALARGQSVDEMPVAVFLDEIDNLSTPHQKTLAEVLSRATCPVMMACNDLSGVGQALQSLGPVVEMAGESWRSRNAVTRGDPAPTGGLRPFEERLQEAVAGRGADLRPSEYGQVSWALARAGRPVAAAEWDRWWGRYRKIGRPIEKYLLRVLKR